MVKTGIAFVLPVAAFLAGVLILTSQWSISDVYRIRTGVTTDTACNSSSTSNGGEARSKQLGNKNPSKYSLPLRPKKFVLLSATIGVNARPEPYAYLCALTARNWNNFGFRPIIVLVGSNTEEIEEVISIWTIILSPETTIVPIIVEKPEHQISVAQVSRLLVVSALSSTTTTTTTTLNGDQLVFHDDDFVRLTDADMMIMNPSPFEAPYETPKNQGNYTASDDIITIFNGKCCPGDYPMHSVGMKVKLFRTIFPIKEQQPLTMKSVNTHVGQAILSQFYDWTNSIFPYFHNDTQNKILQHGKSKTWSMDQSILYKKINEAVKLHRYELELAPGPKGRIHFSRFDPGKGEYDDVHLASFSFQRYSQWLDSFVSESIVLFGHRRMYEVYTQTWKRKFYDTHGSKKIASN